MSVMGESIFLSGKKRPNYTVTYANHGISTTAGSAMLQLGIFSSTEFQLTSKEHYIVSYSRQRILTIFHITPNR